MVAALKSDRRKLIVQTLAVMANLCFMNKDQVTKHAVKHKTYTIIIDILKSKDKKFMGQDRIYFLGLNSLFYLCLDKSIGTDIYKDNSFFEWLFDLFLEKSKYFQDKNFWIRAKLKNKQKVKQSKSNDNVEEKNNDNDINNEYNTDEDCRLIVEILRILFNFTLVETNVLKFKLDTFPADYQRKVVGRAVGLLTIPCEYEPEFDLYCNAKLEYLCETPGLISIKLKICNVALYDGDILGMNLKVESADAICKLMEFYCMQTRHSFETQPQIAAMMMFLKHVCRYNGKVRAEIKRYIFGDDAEPDTDSESDEELDPQEARNKQMRPKNLDKVKDGEETIKNLLIKHCTSVNYNVKRTVAEFLFALFGEDQKEMTRLCGLGNSIAIFMEKGIPGFINAADQGMDLSKMAKEKRAKERKDKTNKKSNDDKPNDDDNNDDGSSNDPNKPQSG